MELKNTAFAIVFTFVLFGLFASAMFQGSTDPSAVPLQNYSGVKNFTNIGSGNFSYADTGAADQNMMLIMSNINQAIVDAQTTASTGNFMAQLATAFGLLAAITIGMGQLLIGIFANGFNLIAGIGANIIQIPAPWNYLAFTALGLATVSFVVYVTLTVADYITGRRS